MTGSLFLRTAALLGLLGLALGFTHSIQASLAQRTATGCEPGSVKPLVSPDKTYAFDARGVVGVYRKPGGRAFARFGARNANGVRTVFAGIDAVLGARCRAAWFRVLLPMKPNGSTGYVRAPRVKVRIVRSRVVIDLSSRRVAVYGSGRLALTTTAAIGAPFSLSFVSKVPGRPPPPIVRLRISRVSSSIHQSLSGETVRSRMVAVRRRTETRSSTTVHFADAPLPDGTALFASAVLPHLS